MSLGADDLSLKNKKKYKRSQSFYFNSDPPSESKLINLNLFRNIYINQLKNNNYYNTNNLNSPNTKKDNINNNDCLNSFIQKNNLSENIKKELKNNCW